MMATARPDDALAPVAAVRARPKAGLLSRIPWSGLLPLLLGAGTIWLKSICARGNNASA